MHSRACLGTSVCGAAAETPCTLCCGCVKHDLFLVGTSATKSKLQVACSQSQRTPSNAACAVAFNSPCVLQVAERIERDLELVGLTAIEDKLQDGVPDTIRLLIDAGMKARSRGRVCGVTLKP